MIGRRHYREYKEASIPWICTIPKNWEVEPLFSAVSERKVKNLGMRESNLLSLSYGQIVRRDINSNEGLLPDSFETYQIVDRGDIVLRMTDLQNDQRSLRSALVRERGIITSAYIAVRPHRINPCFLDYLMRAYDVQKVFYSMGGGLRQSLKFEELRRLPLVIPSKPEQIEIVRFLDRETARIDTLIAKKTRFIELLKEKRQAVITKAVTKGLDPDVKTKDSKIEWIGEVPAHWSVQPIKSLVNIGNGSTPSKESREYWECGEFPWLTSSCVNLEVVVSAEQFVTDIALRECHLPIISPPAVLVGITGQGKTRGMASTLMIEATINQHIAFLKPTSDKIGVEYLRRFLDAAYAWLRLHSEGVGSTKGAITCEQLANTKIAVPPLHEQEFILEVIHRQTERLDLLVSKTQDRKSVV